MAEDVVAIERSADGALPGRTTEALAFPGQGVDPVATLAVLADHAGHPLVAVVRRLTGRPELHPEDLADTRVAQPCIVAAGLLSASSELLSWPEGMAAVVGHSLGEISACAFAGVFPFVNALELVALRARLGTDAQRGRPGRMVAVMRLDHDTVDVLRREAIDRAGGALDVAVVNGHRQVVLTGDERAVDALVPLVFDHGGLARILGIGGAFHSPLMRSATDEFGAAIEAMRPRDPVMPVVCSTGPVIRSGAEAAAALAASLVTTVHWPSTVECAASMGVTGLIDAGPGETICNLGKHLPTLPVRPLRARTRD